MACQGKSSSSCWIRRSTLLELTGLPRTEHPPALSLFRQFSAPVHWEASQEPAELFTLLACDNDPFARWDAGQQLWRRLLLARASGSPNADLERQMLEALTVLLAPMENRIRRCSPR